MTNPEMSNEFDILYNNITSNQAPGLDEYEKSVFLTKAQDEIIKAYVVNKDMKEFELKLGELTDDEREIILKGCLINYYKG